MFLSLPVAGAAAAVIAIVATAIAAATSLCCRLCSDNFLCLLSCFGVAGGGGLYLPGLNERFMSTMAAVHSDMMGVALRSSEPELHIPLL